MITLLHARVERLKQQQKPLTTLTTVHKNRLPPHESWPSTRQLVEALNFVICRTRYFLLDVVERKQVLATSPLLIIHFSGFRQRKPPSTEYPF